MAAHNPFRRNVMPDVEKGVILGFVCPSCEWLMGPTIEPCGCYACSNCGQHVPQRRFAAACDRTAELVNNPSRN